MAPEDFASIPALEGLVVELEFRGHALVEVHIREGAAVREPVTPAARAAADLVARFLQDGRTDLSPIPVDMAHVSAFDAEVLVELRKVRAGQTVTYGELAARLGRGPGASRAVGGAMARNPMPIVLPCHRVVQGDGSLGHYSGFGGVATKLKLLQLEGSRFG